MLGFSDKKENVRSIPGTTFAFLLQYLKTAQKRQQKSLSSRPSYLIKLRGFLCFYFYIFYLCNITQNELHFKYISQIFLYLQL